MNPKNFLKTAGFFSLILFVFILAGCGNDDTPEPEDLLSVTYKGTLEVIYTNVYPP